ncbi:extracellular serine/threonine protein kinase four-jointed [Ischnura elegans]|uniref:extracellular serine/threonine protein kinase four-jointed n=1 Tax=Ischnura elegans TaxID=197161 RepID=UPI001ED8B382|nr:extracellular serine/threonine protein kinase four-jointed [Ischnura elegans]XP_046382749.1 extracellular serine/threonine protein kinase four-jointed [Ischnura elegans]
MGARPFLLPGEQPRSLRSLLLLTAALAFLVGIVIGVTIPLYVLPPPAALAYPQQRRSLPPPTLSPAPQNFVRSGKTSSDVPAANSIESFQWAYSEGKGWRRRTSTSTGTATPHPPSIPFVDEPKVDEESASLPPPLESPSFQGVSFVTPSIEGEVASAVAAAGAEAVPAPKEEWPDVISGAFWGETIESAIPKGFADSDSVAWRRTVRSSAVVGLEEGCGRMQNRLLTLEGGIRACARYRQNTDQIQGEIFGFYLAGLLGMGGHVAPSSLAVVGRGASASTNGLEPGAEVDRWAAVRGALGVAQWADGKAVVLTQYVDGLGPAFIPPLLRGGDKRMHPPDVKSIIRDGTRASSLANLQLNASSDSSLPVTRTALSPALLKHLTELAQWSDLLVFDYLTANLDRVVNNLYNLQWNPAMLDSPAHNLARLQGAAPNTLRPASPEGSTLGEGHLLFLDNESALLHGYRLLPKYERYHASLLDSSCVFRRSTADAIRRLRAKRPEVGEALRRSFQNFDPEFRDVLPFLPEKSLKILNLRIERVHEHIIDCQRRYESKVRQNARKDGS